MFGTTLAFSNLATSNVTLIPIHDLAFVSLLNDERIKHDECQAQRGQCQMFIQAIVSERAHCKFRAANRAAVSRSGYKRGCGNTHPNGQRAKRHSLPEYRQKEYGGGDDSI